MKSAPSNTKSSAKKTTGKRRKSMTAKDFPEQFAAQLKELPEHLKELPEQLKELPEHLRELPEQLKDQWTTFQENLQKDIRKELQQVEKRARKSEAFASYQKTLKDLDKRLGTLRDQLFTSLGVASKDDVSKLQKKVNTLNKKLNDISQHAA